MEFRKILFGLAAGAALALTGCSDVCDWESSCEKDSEISESDIKSCEEAVAGDCGSEQEEYFACFQDKQVCGDDDKTDALKTLEECKDEAKAVADCCKENPDTDGCSTEG